MASEVLRFSTVLSHEARAVGLAIRRYMLVWSVLVAFACVMILRATLAWNRADGQFIPVELHPSVIALPLMLFGLLAPLSVWRDEQPRRRTYLHSLPVSRARLQATKATAGWLWVMLAGVAITFAMWLAGAAANLIGSAGAVSALPPRSMLNQFEGPVPVWQWMIPFVIGTIAYLVGTIPALLSNSPGHWFTGGFLSLIALLMISEGGFEISDVAEPIFDGIFSSRYGIPSLIAVTDDLTLTTWLIAILLWGSVAVLGSSLASRRYYEP